MIRIKENAAKSNSFLSGRSILLDKDAKSDAIPGLEIFTNDVKATHSASVAQIDEEQPPLTAPPVPAIDENG